MKAKRKHSKSPYQGGGPHVTTNDLQWGGRRGRVRAQKNTFLPRPLLSDVKRGTQNKLDNRISLGSAKRLLCFVIVCRFTSKRLTIKPRYYPRLLASSYLSINFKSEH
jgi:hypothetical protein